MISAKYDFEIEQGTDVSVPLILKDKDGGVIDLTGYKARMQMRQQIASPEAVDTLTTENDRIEIDGTNGKITLHFTHEVTETYPAASLVYDVEIVSPGNLVTRILKGKVKILGEVTRVGSNESL